MAAFFLPGDLWFAQVWRIMEPVGVKAAKHHGNERGKLFNSEKSGA